MKTKEALIKEAVEGFKFPEKQQLLRTTLRFTRKGHEAIKKLSKLQGEKIADIFDMAFNAYEFIEEKIESFPEVTNKEGETIRKTYIIRKNTLSKITDHANKNRIPRDQFIDAIVKILLLIVDKETTSKKEKYLEALDELINPFAEHADEVEKKLIEKLGRNDPIVSRYYWITHHLMEISEAINEFLSEGTPIEP
ncbi:MAG: hypothetical protein A2X54_06690 [Nitrospirae bacterium GWF2_44_13]|nr:MAG: hypothetical protein A2X54_06690 [Nitrospirae bacterium GWF2_44_13]OGW63862.1 MAG: hypothetical protein A2222_08145 [Nitrospirae bacterium RIFOXYA2_FULL_44_9]OGW72011.1 MAG: hypothetical protein A2484_07235 [Nitrospirae bacterium RIFOXYC2_FULL_44_7]HBG92067.1 hypothetical protein [Nitrospiraceae bacterium]HBU05029.1 hypothetical protein [Nitrospiraceae bacterium]